MWPCLMLTRFHARSSFRNRLPIAKRLATRIASFFTAARDGYFFPPGRPAFRARLEPFNGRVCHLENVRLARVMLARDAGYDPIAGADDVPAFKRFDPAVIVHFFSTMGALLHSVNVWMAEIFDDSAFPFSRPSVFF